MSVSKMTIDGENIQVWTADHCDPPCVAVNMDAAIELCDGYDLSEEEKTDVTWLMAGYCSFIDQHNLTGYGATEFEAIADLFAKATNE